MITICNLFLASFHQKRPLGKLDPLNNHVIHVMTIVIRFTAVEKNGHGHTVTWTYDRTLIYNLILIPFTVVSLGEGMAAPGGGVKRGISLESLHGYKWIKSNPLKCR